MEVRLGYVAMSMELKDASPSKTVSVTAFNNIKTSEAKKHKLKKIALENLNNTLRILRYNIERDIMVYRFSSKLIPLATYDLGEWNYKEELKDEFEKIGNLIKKFDMRVSFHPDHFVILNSISDKVYEDSVKTLEYHNNMYEAMNLDDKYKMVLHIGGIYSNKSEAIKRFYEGFDKLPDRIKKRIVLENDDKCFSANDVLRICKNLKVPMVLDVHHHNCLNNGEKLDGIIEECFNTWNNEYFPPKVHFSSPKSEKNFRAHSDYIDSNDFFDFIDKTKRIDRNFDVMIEAKEKDKALLELRNRIDSNTSSVDKCRHLPLEGKA